MGSKYCGKCGEQVDEAKAFCPGCGNAFVEEEKRTTVTEFEGSEKTVQLGQTMYNQLLSDMGLSIGKPTAKDAGGTRLREVAHHCRRRDLRAGCADNTRGCRYHFLSLAAIRLSHSYQT